MANLHVNFNENSAADEQFAKAYAKFEEALSIPGKAFKQQIHHSYARFLNDQARSKKGEEAEAIFQTCFARYEEAVKTKRLSKILYDYARAVYDNAQLRRDEKKPGPAVDELDQKMLELTVECESRLSEETAVPDVKQLCQIYNNWGCTLMSQCKLHPEKYDYDKHAMAKLQQAEDHIPNFCQYNFACIYSITNRFDLAEVAMGKSKAANFLPPKKFMDEDEDLNPLRGLPWFQALMASLPPD